MFFKIVKVKWKLQPKCFIFVSCFLHFHAPPPPSHHYFIMKLFTHSSPWKVLEVQCIVVVEGHGLFRESGRDVYL